MTRRMRGRRARTAVSLAGAVLAAVAPAAAARQAIRISASGGIVVTWHGDPAGGCQAKGICGYSGTYAQPLASDSQTIDTFVGSRTLNPGIDLSADQPAVVRVRRDGPGGPGTCVDLPGPGLSDIVLETGADGR